MTLFYIGQLLWESAGELFFTVTALFFVFVVLVMVLTSVVESFGE